MKEMKTIKKAIKKIRKNQACILALEEISELISELTYLLTEGNKRQSELEEEIADVTIMTELIKGTFKISNKDIDDEYKFESDAFKAYSQQNKMNDNIKSFIYELSNLQKSICKKGRGRHNKKDIIKAIVGVKLHVNFFKKKDIIRNKECIKWEEKKLTRMSKRIKKNTII